MPSCEDARKKRSHHLPHPHTRNLLEILFYECLILWHIKWVYLSAYSTTAWAAINQSVVDKSSRKPTPL